MKRWAVRVVEFLSVTQVCMGQERGVTRGEEEGKKNAGFDGGQGERALADSRERAIPSLIKKILA